MNLSSLSVKRPVTTVMLILIVVVLGFVSFTRLAIDLFPNIEVPVAIVNTTYSNVAPAEIETMITRPIEEVVGTVENIDSIQSMTMEGSSIVVVLFNYGTDMQYSTLKIREKVDMIKPYLPEGASDPMVMQYDINAQPIMQIGVSGSNLTTLKEYAETTLKTGLEQIAGVASISVSGGYENYISIKVHTEKLNGYGLSMDTLAQMLAAENINLPAGSVNKGDKELLVRTVGEFDSIDQIKDTKITLKTGSVIQLSDVADINLSNKELETISKINGKPAVSLSIQKQSGTNTVNVADKVREKVEALNMESDYDIDIIVDLSVYIKRSISQVGNNAIIGGVLAVLVLFIFLRNVRSTIIIGLSVPISVIATFALIYFNNITLNMMTLGGLALGIGMLVDNSVVVLENIYRYRQEGYSKVKAAVEGAKEVAMSVTASTFTTIAVFLPMVFVEGITSIMFRELALTVTFSLLSSLVVALTLIPMMSSKMLKVDEMRGEHHVTKFRIFGAILDKTDKIYSSVETTYQSLLKWAIKHRKTVIFSAIALFVGSILSIQLIGVEFFPTADEGNFTIDIELENGAQVTDTGEAIDTIVARLEGIDEIEKIFSNTSGGNFVDVSQNKGQIQGVLKSVSERERSVFEVTEEIEERIKHIPGVKTTVTSQSSMMGVSGGSPITISIKGDDFEVLGQLSDQVVDRVKKVEGTKNVVSSLSETIPQVEIKLKRERASIYGLTTAQVANSVKAVIDGRTATKYKMDGEEIDVIIEGDAIYSESISNLKQVLIQSPTGAVVPLELIADVSISMGPVHLDREDQSRVINITSDIQERDLASVMADIRAEGASISVPKGYTINYGGEMEDINEAFGDLFLALGLAVLLVYMILAAQFESLLTPFIIMFSTPLAFAGGLLGLLISGRTINITSLIGFILLSGIVVNNAIVLIAYINTRRSKGEERNEAIIKAGPIRLRPILMTTLTTVLAMIPLGLGIGEGAELQAPMATVVIFGLLVATLLTLIFIPVVYTVIDDFVTKRKKKREKRRAKRKQALAANK